MCEVVFISASWCKRCYSIKPEIAKVCALAGATLTFVNFDEMDDSDKAEIRSLPTIRMDGVAYTSDSVDTWKTNIYAKTTMSTTDTNF